MRDAVLCILCGAWLCFWYVVLPLSAHQPPAEGAMGQCASYRIALDKLSFADHELSEGYVSIGKLTLMAPPEGDAMMRLKELAGEDVELIIRPVKCRAQERIVR